MQTDEPADPQDDPVEMPEQPESDAPAEPDRAAQLKDALSADPPQLETAVDDVLSLPWTTGVRAVGDCWQGMSLDARRDFIDALGAQDSDPARRIRLSLARGLSAQDPRSAGKLIAGVCTSMESAEGGLRPKDRKTFAGVLFGSGKPWLLHLPLSEWEAGELGPVLRCTLAVSQHSPAFAQLWIFRWIADAGKLGELPEEQIRDLAKSVKRWHPKLQKELKAAVPELPAPIAEVLVQQAETRPEPAEAAPAVEPRSFARPERPAARRAAPAARAGTAPSGFDLSRSLREIEAYVAQLQTELQQARAAARAPSSRGSVRPAGDTEETETLRRHNARLEETVQELQSQLEELASDHQDRAAASGEAGEVQQFKTLLGLKLAEDFADYKALCTEAEVVRRHPADVLVHVVEVLQAEGIPLPEEG